MLAEIEGLIIKVLQDNVKGVSKEKVSIRAGEVTPPAITILSQNFKIESQMTDSTGQKNIQLDESFSVEGDQPSYTLKNKPMENGIEIESPPGTLLKENVDYLFDLNLAKITFVKNTQAKLKGKIRYSTQSDFFLKTLRLGAKYIIDVWGKDWNETDALAEEVLKALLMGNEEFESQRIHLKPIAGRIKTEEGKDMGKRIQLAYLFEKELEIETVAPTIAKIEISQKRP